MILISYLATFTLKNLVKHWVWMAPMGMCYAFFLFIQGNVSILKNVPILPKTILHQKVAYAHLRLRWPVFSLIRSQQFSQRELSQPVAAPRHHPKWLTLTFWASGSNPFTKQIDRQKSTPEKAWVLLKGEHALSVCKALSSIQHRWREACLHVLEERNAMDGECWETILETVTTPSVNLSPHHPFPPSFTACPRTLTVFFF